MGVEDARYVLGLAVATDLGPNPVGTSGGNERTAIIASGYSSGDLQAIGPMAFSGPYPILYAGPTGLSQAVKDALSGLGIDHAIIVGGPLAVSTAVVAALESDGVSVLRVAGSDYTGTSVSLAGLETASPATHQGFGWDLRTPGLAVARGNGFQDGLAGASLAARGYHGSGPVPILLTQSQTTIGTDLVHYLRDVGGHGIGPSGRAVGFLMVLGGPEALVPSVVDAMARDL